MDQVESRFPKSIRPKQLRALALLYINDWQRSQAIVAELQAAGENDPETLNILALTWREKYAVQGNKRYLKVARDLHAQAFEQVATDYLSGINAASASLLLGEDDVAVNYASKVQALVSDRPALGDFLRIACAAEAQLIKREFDEAARLYEAAIVSDPEAVGLHRMTFRQIERLLDYLKPPLSTVQGIIDIFEYININTKSGKRPSRRPSSRRSKT